MRQNLFTNPCVQLLHHKQQQLPEAAYSANFDCAYDFQVTYPQTRIRLCVRQQGPGMHRLYTVTWPSAHGCLSCPTVLYSTGILPTLQIQVFVYDILFSRSFN